MIRVTIEVLPHGKAMGREILSTVDIVNMGPQHQRTGKHLYGLYVDSELQDTPIRHNRDDGFMALVKKVFQEVVR
jgi:hypothetical protein